MTDIFTEKITTLYSLLEQVVDGLRQSVDTFGQDLVIIDESVGFSHRLY